MRETKKVKTKAEDPILLQQKLQLSLQRDRCHCWVWVVTTP